MCNLWNTNGNYGCGCGGNYTIGSLFNNGYQAVCRDACGNIRVNNAYSCRNHCGCCRHTCSPCGLCGNTNGNTTNDTVGNSGTGNYGCVTVCGTTTPVTTPATNNAYYTQYGASRSCGCGWYNR